MADKGDQQSFLVEQHRGAFGAGGLWRARSRRADAQDAVDC